MKGTRLRIVDGRIEISSSSMMSGYFPGGGTEGAFQADGWFRTEDHGRIDESGCLHVLGRTSELIVTGGENVYPAEVERELEQIPGVRSACVFGVADDTWGQVVCAALVLEEGPEWSSSSFRTQVSARLASYKRPRRVALVEGLPSTPAGKLDRQAAAAAATPRLNPVA